MFGYRLLLWLYPASFRVEHGKEMMAIFAASLRAAEGLGEKASVWLSALGDALVNGPAAHLELLRHDLRYAFRYFRRAPGFAATVIAVSALGIGATTATYSVLDHLLLRRLPFPEPDRLLKLYQDDQARGYQRTELSPGNFRDWRGEARSFANMGSYHLDSANLGGVAEPVRLAGAGVSADFFPTLGVTPALGRVFEVNDDKPGAPGTLVLGYRLWQERFGGDPAAIGAAVKVNDEPFTVIGVMPADFRFPSRDTQYWKPQRFGEANYEDRTDCWLVGIGRLAPGATEQSALAELKTITARLAAAYPEANENIGASLFGLRQEIASGSRLMVMVLFGASLSLLLIACTNLASLLVARSLERQQELSLRSALGAGRERLIRQLLTECLLLAAAGSLIGLAIAAIATPLGAQLVPAGLPVADAPALDLRILLFALATTFLTGVGFGIVPSLRACREVSSEALREGQRTGQGAAKQRLRGLLVAAEVGLSLGLLVVAGLLGRALLEVRDTTPGFDQKQVVTLRTWLPHPRYQTEAARHDFYTRVLAGVEALPGVGSAAYTSFLPMVMGGGIWKVQLEGQNESNPAAADTVSLRFVTPGYFETMGIPLRTGRDVADADVEGEMLAAVVSESFATRSWPGQEALGRTFKVAGRQRQVVGVVGDVKVRGLERRMEPQLYLPARQVEDGAMPFYDPKDLAIRTSQPLDQILPELRRIVRSVDPEQPISDVQTLSAIVGDQTASRALQARVLLAFALAALLLAGIGVHGLLAYIVSVRRPELGIRLALGARAGDLIGGLVRQVGRLALAGILVGALLGLAAGKLLESLLAGISPADPATFALALGAILLTTLLGSLLPLRGVARVDPVEVIRRG